MRSLLTSSKVWAGALSICLAVPAIAQNGHYYSQERGHWNKKLTDLMRESHTDVFANWDNDPSIQIGAIGYIDPNTGNFTLISNSLVENSTYFLDKDKNEKWDFASQNTSKQTAEVKLNGSYKDPKTGMKVEAGMKHTWQFSSADSIAASYVIAKESITLNARQMVNDNWKVIKEAAESADYSSSGEEGIYQGFGVITGVKWAKRGVTVASSSEKGSYSMTTSVNFFSPKDDSVKITPKYIEENESKSATGSVFPVDASQETLVPVAFTFTSIEGKKPIIGWTRPINQLELRIESRPGSTYITKWNVSYKTSDGVVRRQQGGFPAPQSAAVYFPKDATNIELEVKLPGIFSSNYCKEMWHDPLNQWVEGRRVMQTYGIWPKNAWCEITAF